VLGSGYAFLSAPYALGVKAAGNAVLAIGAIVRSLSSCRC
jgi:hypothetical protein